MLPPAAPVWPDVLQLCIAAPAQPGSHVPGRTASRTASCHGQQALCTHQAIAALQASPLAVDHLTTHPV